MNFPCSELMRNRPCHKNIPHPYLFIRELFLRLFKRFKNHRQSVLRTSACRLQAPSSGSLEPHAAKDLQFQLQFKIKQRMPMRQQTCLLSSAPSLPLHPQTKTLRELPATTDTASATLENVQDKPGLSDQDGFDVEDY